MYTHMHLCSMGKGPASNSNVCCVQAGRCQQRKACSICPSRTILRPASGEAVLQQLGEEHRFLDLTALLCPRSVQAPTTYVCCSSHARKAQATQDSSMLAHTHTQQANRCRCNSACVPPPSTATARQGARCTAKKCGLLSHPFTTHHHPSTRPAGMHISSTWRGQMLHHAALSCALYIKCNPYLPRCRYATSNELTCNATRHAGRGTCPAAVQAHLSSK